MKFNLKQIRERSNMTQAELAEKTGVSRVTISRLETGELQETTLGTLSRLADTLRVSIDDLVKS